MPFLVQNFVCDLLTRFPRLAAVVRGCIRDIEVAVCMRSICELVECGGANLTEANRVDGVDAVLRGLRGEIGYGIQLDNEIIYGRAERFAWQLPTGHQCGLVHTYIHTYIQCGLSGVEQERVRHA